jgi:hypothetical protein
MLWMLNQGFAATRKGRVLGMGIQARLSIKVFIEPIAG